MTEALEPTLEEKEKIRHWLESGLSRERVEYLQCLTHIQFKYLQVFNQGDDGNKNMTNPQTINASFGLNELKNGERKPRRKILKSRRSRNQGRSHKQSQIHSDSEVSNKKVYSQSRKSKHTKAHLTIKSALKTAIAFQKKSQQTKNNGTGNKNETSHENSNPKTDLIVPVPGNNAEIPQRKIIKPIRLKRIRSTNNHRRRQSQMGSSDEWTHAKKDPKNRKIKRSKFHSTKKTEPKAETARQKAFKSAENANSTPASNISAIEAGPNCETALQILPTVVYINPNLNKVKIETDYVPIIKAEPEAEINAGVESSKPVSCENLAAGSVTVREESVIINIRTPDSISKSTSNSEAISSQEEMFKIDKILRAIFRCISTKDLLNRCSLVNKRWNKFSRLLLQEDRNVNACINQGNPCQDLRILNQLIEESLSHFLTVPYSGLRFVDKNENPNGPKKHFHDKDTLNSNGEDVNEFPAILSAVQFKNLHLTGAVLSQNNEQCPSFKLLAKILQVQASNLVRITLEPFFCTAEDFNENSLYEYETCVRKFMCDYFPAVMKADQGLANVKQIAIVEKNVYDSKSAIYLKFLQRQLEDLLEFTPKLEAIQGSLPIELLQIATAYGKNHCVKELKFFLHCSSTREETEALSKLKNIEQAIFNGLQLEKLEIENIFNFDSFPHLLAISTHVTSTMLKNSSTNLISLSITHQDFIMIFGGKNDYDFPGPGSLSNLLHLSILNYEYKLDPSGTLMLCAVDFTRIFPGLKRIIFDLKNPPRSPSPVWRCLQEKISKSSFLMQPCTSIEELFVICNASSKECRKNENLNWKIMAGFIQSFPNIKLFAYSEMNGDPEKIKNLLRMLLSPDFGWRWGHLQVVRMLDVALWEMTGNFDSWVKIILGGNYLARRNLKRLQIEVGKNCQGACANGELFWNQRQDLVSKELATLVCLRMPRFSVEIDLGHWNEDGECNNTLPNLPEFFKCVSSFQD